MLNFFYCEPTITDEASQNTRFEKVLKAPSLLLRLSPRNPMGAEGIGRVNSQNPNFVILNIETQLVARHSLGKNISKS